MNLAQSHNTNGASTQARGDLEAKGQLLTRPERLFPVKCYSRGSKGERVSGFEASFSSNLTREFSRRRCPAHAGSASLFRQRLCVCVGGGGRCTRPIQATRATVSGGVAGLSYLLTLGEEYLSSRPSPRKLQKNGRWECLRGMREG